MRIPNLVRTFTALALLALLCTCSRTLLRDESHRVFDVSTGLLHQMHLAEIPTNSDVPESLDVPCTDGGTVEMLVLFDGQGTAFTNIVGITHDFVDCQHQGLLMNGPLDYNNIVMHGGGTCFDIDIVGELEITGELEGRCTIEARETCDGFEGLTCGHEL